MMDGGYEISSASDDEPMRKLYLLLAQVGYYIELKAYQRIKVPFRFERAPERGRREPLDRKLHCSE